MYTSGASPRGSVAMIPCSQWDKVQLTGELRFHMPHDMAKKRISVQFWGIKVDAIIPLIILLLLKLEYFITYIYVPCLYSIHLIVYTSIPGELRTLKVKNTTNRGNNRKYDLK